MERFGDISLLLGVIALLLLAMILSPGAGQVASSSIPYGGGCGVIDVMTEPDATYILGKDHPGRGLFEDNCSVCHGIREEVVGPALYGVHLRVDSVKLREWITDSRALIASGDEYAINLYEEYGHTQMPSYLFKEKDLDVLIDYLRVVSGAPSYLPDSVLQQSTPDVPTGGNTP